MIIGKFTMILCDIGNSTFHFLIGENDLKIGVNENLDRDVLANIDD